ncbi:twin-arginine translocase TatA/TatE family subunit [Cohnella rhizosphaerae]|uniref:Sec-independent protein translocase protein TatA n=1 Tax=Cohnella rhizosphaerae TaxID=1457232 RepID=A0A9X4KWS8_9BACL|nr:twin-arginine translocase TatA/TatE family subunit [Cohnella rhizosphaerae]MDG0812734.1 twin-arginine translocase TatA/TatE family subunit [Cohnella rhizosphaerae]
MPNIGSAGLILLVLVALLLFGPSKLPALGSAFGRTLREFRSGSKELLADPETERHEEREAQPMSTKNKTDQPVLPRADRS